MSKKITKPELIAAVAEVANASKAEVNIILSSLAVVAEQMLKNGSTITIMGVVKLTPKDRAARIGRNPATGATMEVAAKRTVGAKSLVKI